LKSPRQARSRQTVEALLTATARVLVRHGFDGASTNRIAAAAGVSIGSLYQYFPNKQALVGELIDRHVEQQLATLHRELSAGRADAPSDIVRSLVHGLFEAHRVEPELYAVLAELVPRTGRVKRLQELESTATSLVQSHLEAYAQSLPPIDARHAAFVLVSAVSAVARAAASKPKGLRIDRIEAETVTLILRYLGI
jgi:AcrR family transcriptional regulator